MAPSSARGWWHERRRNGVSGSVLTPLGSPRRGSSRIIRQSLEKLSGNSERAPFRGLTSLRDALRDALLDALCPTDKRAVRPVRLLSRQSLEEAFSEVRIQDPA